MTHPSRRLFLLSASAIGGTVLPSLSGQSLAQAVLNADEGFPGLTGSIGDQVDYNIAPPAPSGRAWDAVAHYTGTNTALLAPKVAEVEPADPPMPHFKPLSFLEQEGHIYRADIERSNARGRIEAEGQPDGFLTRGKSTPDGFILIIPPGKYQLTNAAFKIVKSKGYNEGARFVFRGEIGEDGSHPELIFSKGTLSVSEHRNTSDQTVFAGFEVENLELSSTATGPTGGPGTFLRYYRYDNVLFSGGFRHAQFPSTWPMVGIYNNCVFARSGGGSGVTHSFYAGNSQAVIARNCLFTSAQRESHPLKTYASQLDLRGCTIANWWHQADADEGFYSDQSPLDIGVWGQSVIANCHLIRRGNPVRTRNNPFIDIRNRLYEKGTFKYQVEDVGTDATEVDYHDIDNEVGTANASDPASDLLYRHLIVNNKFYNGVLPDNSIDPHIDSRRGFLIRNNGSIYNWANGKGALKSKDTQFHSTPSDYGVRNDRSVVYVSGNEQIGVPVNEEYPGPYKHTSDPHPVVDLPATFPGWVENRLANEIGDLQWWDQSWPSNVEYHPPPLET